MSYKPKPKPKKAGAKCPSSHCRRDLTETELYYRKCNGCKLSFTTNKEGMPENVTLPRNFKL